MKLWVLSNSIYFIFSVLPAWSLPKSADRDQDGVADKFDKCKETPSGTKVDKSGCTIVEKKKATVCRPKINGEAEDLGNGMVSLPSGCFCMGSNDGWYDDEKPVHRVCLSAFSMDKYEVTQGEYERVMGSNPSYFSSCSSNCPVEGVDWNESSDYCRKVGKRLPTEAEWEYAARAGTTTKWYCGNDESCLDRIAWYDGNSGSKTHPVGQKQPNDWGLYDMAGNVWEWTSDWNGAYSSESQQDPRGASSGSGRVDRGGSWDSDPADLRSAFRNYGGPGDRVSDLGFRCVAPVSK